MMLNGIIIKLIIYNNNSNLLVLCFLELFVTDCSDFLFVIMLFKNYYIYIFNWWKIRITNKKKL